VIDLQSGDKVIPQFPISSRNVVIHAPTATVSVSAGVPSIEATGKSKEEAQKRLDEDTRKVGFVRGEVYQVDDGTWGIAWGGKC
jgi:hypothetical protein